MAEENLKDFTISWIMIGFLCFVLMSFAISFMYNNNPTGLDDGSSQSLNNIVGNQSYNLLQSVSDSNQVLNITASTNPEASQLGSRDSVSSAFKTQSSGVRYFQSIKLLISWIFAGEIGQMLMAVFTGIFSFTSIYFITKWIRNGF